MKQKILLIFMLLLGISGAYAQKGMWGVGADIGGRYDLNDGGNFLYGATAKVQYGISGHYRIQPFASIYGGMEKTEFQVGIDNHFFFTVNHKARPYFIAGLAYGVMPSEDKLSDYDSQRYNRIYNYETGGYEYVGNTKVVGAAGTLICRAGFGVDIRLSHSLSCQIEALCPLGPFAKYLNAYGHIRYDEGYKSGLRCYGPQLKIGLAYNF
ncbi:MAG: hypothetical protein LIP03_04995 [Bacteroidales bacterium]|nr:hypothetical protein [Bacteroidales bacterium]